MVIMRHSVRTAEIIIISRQGQGIGYTIPLDLVLVLLWFLSSTTAQFLAILAMAAYLRLREVWAWLVDWLCVSGWWEDLRLIWMVTMMTMRLEFA